MKKKNLQFLYLGKSDPLRVIVGPFHLGHVLVERRLVQQRGLELFSRRGDKLNMGICFSSGQPLVSNETKSALVSEKGESSTVLYDAHKQMGFEIGSRNNTSLT